MSHAGLLLTLAIAHQPLDRALRASLDALSDPAAVILQLTFGLLAFPLGVLLLAFLLKPLAADKAAEAFLGGSNGLVVAALGAGWVVGGYAPLRGGGEWANFADGVREVFFVRGLGLGAGGLVLWWMGVRSVGDEWV